MIAIKSWYFLYFAANACLFPYFNLIFRRHAELTAQQVGVVSALRPWIGLPAGALLSGAADKWRIHRLILLTAFVLASVGRLSVSLATSFTAVLIIMLIADFAMAPVTIMVDAAALATCKHDGEYGRHRLWGAVGWGLMSAVAGAAMAARSGESYVVFSLYAVLSAATLIPTLSLPWKPLHYKLQQKHAAVDHDRHEYNQARERSDSGPDNSYANNFGTPSSPPPSSPTPPRHVEVHLLQGVKTLLRNTDACVFFLQATIMGFAVGTIDGFLFLYLEDLNASTVVMGLSLTVTCIAETAVFYYSGAIMKALSLDGCFHLCFAAFLIRLGCYTTLAWWPSPWLVLPVELLHGLTFGLTWSAGCAKCALVAPPGLEATTQSVFQGLLFGAGNGIGGLAAGSVYQLFGPQAPFAVASVVVALGWAGSTSLQSIVKARGGSLAEDRRGGVMYKPIELNDF